RTVFLWGARRMRGSTTPRRGLPQAWRASGIKLTPYPSATSPQTSAAEVMPSRARCVPGVDRRECGQVAPSILRDAVRRSCNMLSGGGSRICTAETLRASGAGLCGFDLAIARRGAGDQGIEERPDDPHHVVHGA